MATILYNARTGDPRWVKAGMLTQSDYLAKNCVYRRGTPVISTISPASFGTGTFQLSTTDGRFVYSAPIVAGTPQSVFSQIAGNVGYPFLVTLNAANNLEVSTVTGVAYQMFSNGNLFINTGALNLPPLEAGRLVVPDYANPLAGNNGQVFDTYRYPLLSDNANILSQAVLVAYDNHTNLPADPTALPSINLGRVEAGNCFGGIFRGVMISQLIASNTTTGQLFVETTSGGTGVQGRITTNPTGSTLPIPIGKIQLVDTFAAANQFGRVRIQF